MPAIPRPETRVIRSLKAAIGAMTSAAPSSTVPAAATILNVVGGIRGALQQSSIALPRSSRKPGWR